MTVQPHTDARPSPSRRPRTPRAHPQRGCGITDLPAEILRDIYARLDPPDFARISGSCRHLNGASQDVALLRLQYGRALRHPRCPVWVPGDTLPDLRASWDERKAAEHNLLQGNFAVEHVDWDAPDHQRLILHPILNDDGSRLAAYYFDVQRHEYRLSCFEWRDGVCTRRDQAVISDCGLERRQRIIGLGWTHQQEAITAACFDTSVFVWHLPSDTWTRAIPPLPGRWLIASRHDVVVPPAGKPIFVAAYTRDFRRCAVIDLANPRWPGIPNGEFVLENVLLGSSRSGRYIMVKVAGPSSHVELQDTSFPERKPWRFQTGLHDLARPVFTPDEALMLVQAQTEKLGIMAVDLSSWPPRFTRRSISLFHGFQRHQCIVDPAGDQLVACGRAGSRPDGVTRYCYAPYHTAVVWNRQTPGKPRAYFNIEDSQDLDGTTYPIMDGAFHPSGKILGLVTRRQVTFWDMTDAAPRLVGPPLTDLQPVLSSLHARFQFNEGGTVALVSSRIDSRMLRLSFDARAAA